MKKSIIFVALLSLFVSTGTSVFAKTSGSYVGADLIHSKSSYKSGGSDTSPYTVSDDTSQSFGLKYGYSFNFNSLILAPEVFYDHMNLEMTDSFNDKWQIKKRSGIKLNLGYDITDKFAVLTNIGFARTIYDVEWNSENIYKKNYSSDGLIYGIAFKYSALENIDISLGYDVSKVTMEEPDLIINGRNVFGANVDFDIKTTRLGVSYNF